MSLESTDLPNADSKPVFEWPTKYFWMWLEVTCGHVWRSSVGSVRISVSADTVSSIYSDPGKDPTIWYLMPCTSVSPPPLSWQRAWASSSLTRLAWFCSNAASDCLQQTPKKTQLSYIDSRKSVCINILKCDLHFSLILFS